MPGMRASSLRIWELRVLFKEIVGPPVSPSSPPCSFTSCLEEIFISILHTRMWISFLHWEKKTEETKLRGFDRDVFLFNMDVSWPEPEKSCGVLLQAEIVLNQCFLTPAHSGALCPAVQTTQMCQMIGSSSQTYKCNSVERNDPIRRIALRQSMEGRSVLACVYKGRDVFWVHDLLELSVL